MSYGKNTWRKVLSWLLVLVMLGSVLPLTPPIGTAEAANISATAAVAVPATGVTVTPRMATINVGATQQLTATVAPANATNQAVTWVSSAPTVATVVYDGVYGGLVTGVSAGTTVITVTTADGGHTATSAVTVVEAIPGGTIVTGRVDLPGRADDGRVTIAIVGTNISTTSAADGSFTLTGVPAGAQTLVLSKERFLVRRLTVEVPATSTLQLPELAALKPGDANNDNRVNIQDLTLLASAFRTEVGDERYNANTDFNADGRVNIQDLTLLAGSFRAVGDKLPNQLPTVTITTPPAGATFAQGASIAFYGSATDPEEGALTGASLVWTSNLAGQIGTGESFIRSDLFVGTHTITLTATDSAGATGTASVTITATPPLQIVEVVSAEIYAEEGGVITVTEETSPVLAGLVLDVPPGALMADTVITIGDVVAGLPPLPEEYSFMGSPIQLAPSGLTFQEPVTIQMPLIEDLYPLLSEGLITPEDLLLKKYDEESNSWMSIPIVGIQDNMAIAEIGSFSRFCVAFRPGVASRLNICLRLAAIGITLHPPILFDSQPLPPGDTTETPLNLLLEEATVDAVIDGDTIKVTTTVTNQKKTVRLIGISAPETGFRYSGDAKKRLEALVPNSKENRKVWLETDTDNVRRIDWLGRHLRYVWRDKPNCRITDAPRKMLNALMVSEGLAAACGNRPGVLTRYNLLFFELQQTARDARLGLWKTFTNGFRLEPLTITTGNFSMPLGGKIKFSAWKGNTNLTEGVSWHVTGGGTINNDGTFTATRSGEFTVRAFHYSRLTNLLYAGRVEFLVFPIRTCKTFTEHPGELAQVSLSASVDKHTIHHGETLYIQVEMEFAGPESPIIGMPDVIIWNERWRSVGSWLVNSAGKLVHDRSPIDREPYCIFKGDKFTFNISWNLTDQVGNLVPAGKYRIQSTISSPHNSGYWLLRSNQSDIFINIYPYTEVVTFPDPNLERVIRTAINKPTGPILRSDLLGLTRLEAWGVNISDLRGIEHLTNLTWLNLGGNQISNIDSLAGLTNLTWLNLGGNQISDLAPLVDNTGLGVCDEVHLWHNPLNLTPGLQNMLDIAELRRRGVTVFGI